MMTDSELHEIIDAYIEDCEMAAAWLTSALEAVDEGRRGDAKELLKHARVSPWLKDTIFKYIETHA